MEGDIAAHSKLRELPAVHEVLERLAGLDGRFPRALVTAEIRRVLAEVRREVAAGGEADTHIDARVRAGLEALARPSLRRVINATGVVLHTNLGRAPLPELTPVPGYSNLEYSLATGRRGKRDVHASALLERLLGAPAIVVNNNAAAVYLTLNELAAPGEVIVSRGEMIEIGDGFRIPDIMRRSGAMVREVGTTNRTRVEDYAEAIGEHTRLILLVHPSNFRVTGFTARPERREVVRLARERGVLVYEDLGSGCVVDLRAFGVDEPLVRDSLEAGVDVVSFSGDKLLGGPQAGILAGRGDVVARLRRNPMFRALRADKLAYRALETTLRHLVLEELDRVPALAMIRLPAGEIRERASKLIARLPAGAAEMVEGRSVIGGGSTPEQSLETWLIALGGDAVKRERELRLGDPPVIARIEDDRVVLDLRTVSADEEDALAARLQALSW
jgi:L-seryl-tRNA(Ser) seleniumtransferase